MVTKEYDASFYDSIDNPAFFSAGEIVPEIMSIFNPSSVLDFGSGTGSWLKVFQSNGVNDVIGIDGPWVPKEKLQISESNFIRHDLTKKIDLQRSFDLVISLEVAEHIDEKYADLFVDQLVTHGQIIMFSAAIPHQGGTSHINEQWPTYWAEKFISKGYIVLDLLRPKFWDNPKVDFWYKQNVLIFIKDSKLSGFPNLEKFRIEEKDFSFKLNRIHPEYYSKSAKFFQKVKSNFLVKLIQKFK